MCYVYVPVCVICVCTSVSYMCMYQCVLYVYVPVCLICVCTSVCYMCMSVDACVCTPT